MSGRGNEGKTVERLTELVGEKDKSFFYRRWTQIDTDNCMIFICVLYWDGAPMQSTPASRRAGRWQLLPRAISPPTLFVRSRLVC